MIGKGVNITQDERERKNNIINLDYNKLLVTSAKIEYDFDIIWKNIIKNSTIEIDSKTAQKQFKNFVLYEAIDGSRTTLSTNKLFGSEVETVLYVINYIHILMTLGVRNCYFMIHTSYNRERGRKEFEKILRNIESSAPIIEKYCKENNISCCCICPNKNHELKPLLDRITEKTKNGKFTTYFLFDYCEKWATTNEGKKIIENLPDIDVHIRHTKFQFSGGWLPEKMSRSVFVYSQNGCAYSNWRSDEIVALIAISLMAKLLHKGELLKKTYSSQKEIIYRYKNREIELFNKRIKLSKNPKKLFIIGSPIGILQYYY